PTPLTPRTAGLEGVETSLREVLGDLTTDPGPTDTVTYVVPPERLLPALARLQPRFRRLEYACAIDNRPRGGGFRTVYHLAALEPGKPMLRLAVDLPDESPRVPTITAVYPVADWYEREIADMLVIRIDGHTELHRF